MLKISRLADYSTVVMHFLANHADQHFSAASIAERTGLALPTVSKLLKQLSEAQLLQSSRGANGGYGLAHAADDISVADIIIAIDGQMAMTECSKGDNVCELDGNCQVRGNWQYINSVVLNVLRQLSLTDMGKSMADGETPIHFQPLKRES